MLVRARSKRYLCNLADNLLELRMTTHRHAEVVRPAPDAETERAVRVFLQRLEGKYPVIEAILYGSRARGDHKPDSDADLAVILAGERGDRYSVAGDMAGIEFDVMLEIGVHVQALPLWQDEWRHPERFNNPALIENIKREGLRV